MEPGNDDSIQQVSELATETTPALTPAKAKDENVISVHIQTDDGSLLSLHLPNKTLVGELKTIIHNRRGIPQIRQRLQFAAKRL